MIIFFKIITALGGAWAVSFLLICTIFFLFSRLLFRHIFFLIFVIFTTEISVFWLKYVIALPRPSEISHLINVSGFSFPSGHAATAVALYGAIWYLLLPQIKNQTKKILLSIFTVLLVILIAGSRLVLGVHYVSDIIAGIAIALLWLSMGIIFLENKKY